MVSLPISRAISSVTGPATLVLNRYGSVEYNVQVGDCTWLFSVHNHDGEVALGRPRMMSVAGFDDALPFGGLREDHLRLPVRAVRLAIEKAMREDWADGHRRVVLLAGGFTGPPRERRGPQGRRSLSEAKKVARARVALKARHRVTEEKLLTEARNSGLLHRRPRAHRFTPRGRDLLAKVDAAKKRLLRLARNADRRSGSAVPIETFLPLLLPRFGVDVINAAIEDLRVEHRITAVDAASAEVRCHGVDCSSIHYRRAQRFARTGVGDV